MAGGSSALTGALLDLVYPRSCAACGLAVDLAAGHLCWGCLSGLERVTRPFCEVCGDPVDGNVAHRYTCSSCGRDAPAFDRARSALRYRGRLHPAVHALKYGGASCVARDFSAFLSGCVRAHYGGVLLDAVAAVPLHARRLRERSYNQSALLAAGVARELGLGLARHGFADKPVRGRTPPQRARGVPGHGSGVG